MATMGSSRETGWIPTPCQINKHIMKYFLITALICCFYTDAMAGHSRGNGTCLDDVIHWQNMIDKRSDAPLWEQSRVIQSQAMGKKVTGKTEECETLMEEALRMIRKPYPTE